jgi:purine-binding chemotaxis protein CheW
MSQNQVPLTDMLSQFNTGSEPDFEAPSGTFSNPSVRVESEILTRVIPATTLPSGTITYGVTARVSKRHPSYALRVQHSLPAGVRLLAADPPPSNTEKGRLFWSLGDMEAGQECRIRLTVRPRAGQTFSPEDVTTFHVMFSQVAHLQTPIVQPKPELRVDGPSSIRLGAVATYRIEVANQGNAPLIDASVFLAVPPELNHPQGNALEIPLSPVGPGETLQIEFPLRGHQSGSFELAFRCADQEVELAGEVVAPVLQAEMEILSRAIVREPLSGVVNLRNMGNAPAEHVTALLRLPESCSAVAPDDSPVESPRELRWTLPVLEPMESLRLPFAVRSDVPGESTLQLHVTASETDLLTEYHVHFDFNPLVGSRPLDQFLKSMSDKMLPAGGGAKSGHSPRLSQAPAMAATAAIVFSVFKTLYAVPLTCVSEVVRSRSITPVPNVPPWVLGISSLTGDIVSVVHLGGFLGLDLTSPPNDARMLVCNTEDRQLTVALLVDRVRGLRNLDRDRIRPFPEHLDHPVAEFSRGVTELDGQLIVLLDIERLLQSPKMRELQAV